jgi:hypothetical protein
MPNGVLVWWLESSQVAEMDDPVSVRKHHAQCINRQVLTPTYFWLCNPQSWQTGFSTQPWTLLWSFYDPGAWLYLLRSISPPYYHVRKVGQCQ